jgi:magnesium-dependent phosphatase 1
VGNSNIVDRGGAITIAACSRTYAPTLYVSPPCLQPAGSNIHIYRARKCLSLLLVAPDSKSGDAIGGTRPAIEFFDELEIYPGDLPIAEAAD